MKITSGNISAAWILALGLSVSAGVPGTAGAVTLMDLLRGGPGKVEQDRQGRGLPGVTQPSIAATRDVDPEPLPRVSGPRYYTYKADSTRPVDTSKFSSGLAGVRLSTTPEIAKALESYYNAGAAPIWVSNGDLNERASAVLAFFDTVGDSGLNPADYAISAPSQDVTASISAEPQAQVQNVSVTEQQNIPPAMMRFELALSAKVLAYVQDTNRGRIDPNKLSGYHDFKRKTVNLAPVLKLASMSPDIGAYLRSREPSNVEYMALKAELAKLRNQDKDASNKVVVPADLVLKPGENNADMATVVKAIEHRSSAGLKSSHATTLSGYQQTTDYSPELVEIGRAHV